MDSPFFILGLRPGADEAEIRAAYHAKVKACHPDRFLDPEQKQKAQVELTQLNLAYEEALKMAVPHQSAAYTHSMPLIDSLMQSRRMLAKGAVKSALRELMRSEQRNAAWYALYGEILMQMEDYEGAHSAYREAIRREPENNTYRAGALDAAVALKKSKTLGGKIRKIFSSAKKSSR